MRDKMPFPVPEEQDQTGETPFQKLRSIIKKHNLEQPSEDIFPDLTPSFKAPEEMEAPPVEVAEVPAPRLVRTPRPMPQTKTPTRFNKLMNMLALGDD